MNIRVFYTTSSGLSTVEDINPHIRLIEMKDGLHTIAKESIYRDIEDEKNSMVFIWQDVTPAEGGCVTEDALKGIEVAKMHRQSTEISRFWKRRYTRGIWWFLRAAYFSIVLIWISLIIYIIYEVGVLLNA